MSQRSKNLQVLKRYFRSEKFTDWAYEQLTVNNIAFRISKERKAKYGDFKVDARGNITISVNGNLEQDQFILTFLHEYAHFVVHKCYGRRVSAHGQQWKNAFGKLILDHLHFFGKENRKLLQEFATNPKATGIPIKGKLKEGFVQVKNLTSGDKFYYNKQFYTYKLKRRTRVVCVREADLKEYLFHVETEVEVT